MLLNVQTEAFITRVFFPHFSPGFIRHRSGCGGRSSWTHSYWTGDGLEHATADKYEFKCSCEHWKNRLLSQTEQCFANENVLISFVILGGGDATLLNSAALTPCDVTLSKKQQGGLKKNGEMTQLRSLAVGDDCFDVLCMCVVIPLRFHLIHHVNLQQTAFLISHKISVDSIITQLPL